MADKLRKNNLDVVTFHGENSAEIRSKFGVLREKLAISAVINICRKCVRTCHGLCNSFLG